MDDREWFAEKNQVAHHCLGCHNTFHAHFSRKNLGYCDRCADLMEQGWDIDESYFECKLCEEDYPDEAN